MSLVSSANSLVQSYYLGMTTTFVTDDALGRTDKSRGSKSSSTITVLASVCHKEIVKLDKIIQRASIYLSDAMLNTFLPQICVDCHDGQAVLESPDCRYHPLSSCVCIEHHLCHKGLMVMYRNGDCIFKAPCPLALSPVPEDPFQDFLLERLHHCTSAKCIHPNEAS